MRIAGFVAAEIIAGLMYVLPFKSNVEVRFMTDDVRER